MHVNGNVLIKVDAIEDMHWGQWWTLMILCSLKRMLRALHARSTQHMCMFTRTNSNMTAGL